ncbi:MAG: hypothetical protein AB8B93_18380 [Pseudomonadales bacterium]
MSTQANVFSRSQLGRSALFGVVLGVAVFTLGVGLELWQRGPGNYVILLIVGASMVLLPAYEKIAGLRPAATDRDQQQPDRSSKV